MELCNLQVFYIASKHIRQTWILNLVLSLIGTEDSMENVYLSYLRSSVNLESNILNINHRINKRFNIRDVNSIPHFHADNCQSDSIYYFNHYFKS